MRQQICVFSLVCALTTCAGDLEEVAVETRRIELSGAAYEITLPKKPELLVTRTDPPDRVMRIDFQPGQRRPRYIELSRGAKTPPQFDRSAKFASGTRLTYTLDDSGGGSGGTEVILNGRLKFRNHTLAVECRMQAELYSLSDGEWCLRWLRTMKPIR